MTVFFGLYSVLPADSAMSASSIGLRHFLGLSRRAIKLLSIPGNHSLVSDGIAWLCTLIKTLWSSLQGMSCLLIALL